MFIHFPHKFVYRFVQLRHTSAAKEIPQMKQMELLLVEIVNRELDPLPLRFA